jgi:hypothetical protein
MAKVVGVLEFQYLNTPYTYTNVLDSQFTQYQKTLTINAKGTDVAIGNIFVSSESEILNDKGKIGQVNHVYVLPQGSFQVTYLVGQNSGGNFLPNSVYSATIKCGSDDFLGSIGIINVVTDNTSTRQVKVTFYDRAVYPL